ncbi:transposase [Streptomyces sp. NPDC002328]|uniref:transposase n=1 Tax=Streptomyces sp. NPDC002328 TaxID=3364642 RepID=UPI00369FA0F4
MSGSRIHISDRLRDKATGRQTVAELGRIPSTISREIRRNLHPADGQYRPHAAQARADVRRPRPKLGKMGENPELSSFIQRRLDLRWSPEQICQALRTQFPGRPDMRVAHETLHQALYVQGRGGRAGNSPAPCAPVGPRRKSRRQAQQRTPRFATPMVMISSATVWVRPRRLLGSSVARASGDRVRQVLAAENLVDLAGGNARRSLCSGR